MSAAEITCPACSKVSLLLREPVYEGFSKVGETLKCSACGHVFESEKHLPLVAPPKTKKLFSKNDLMATPRVFQAGEAEALCHHCMHYTVNPFLQWCGKHRKEVEATDTCQQFVHKPAKEPEPEDGEKTDDPAEALRRLLETD